MQPINKMTLQIILTLAFIGVAAGILSGLVGIGGGIIIVPALVYFLHYNQHQAQGTSLGVLVLPVAIVAFLQYYKYCQQNNTPINFTYIAIIASGFLLGGLIGGKIAVNVDQALLKKIFAIILFYLAIKMMNWDKQFVTWVKNIF
ncbi:MAG TPA: sulfite exporter TauE/SafE family protein [Chitinophagaceae bacterium]|nr:sulfite exporter TauE/SafE family protein [Chitinophagaceae bacterium]